MTSFWCAALRVAREMLVQRKYADVEECLSRAQLINLLGEGGASGASGGASGGTELALALRASRNPRPGVEQEATVLFALREARVGIKTIRLLEARNDLRGQIIIVSENGATPFVKRGGMHIFSLPQLCVNVTRHSLVPDHVHVWGQDIEGIDKDALPSLPTSDAVAAFLGFTAGQIIQIDRSTRGNGIPGATYYRKVVAL